MIPPAKNRVDEQRLSRLYGKSIYWPVQYDEDFVTAWQYYELRNTMAKKVYYNIRARESE